LVLLQADIRYFRPEINRPFVMKNVLYTLTLLASVLISSALQAQSIANYKYTFNIKGATDTVYLANYFGKQLYYTDTAYTTKGQFTFSGKDLKPGKYAVVFPGKTYFEVLINEPSFSFTGDTTKLIESMKISGSAENQVFYDYIKFINNEKQLIGPLQAEYQKEGTTEERKKELAEKITSVDKAVKEYQKKIATEKKALLIGQVIAMSLDVDVPDAPILENGRKDSIFQYYFYRDHYFDNVNLKNDALVRTPSFHNKLEEFFDKVVLQNPDTISLMADRLIDKMNPGSDMYKYTVNYVINHFNASKIMGMKSVFVHMGENYYMQGRTPWADSATIAKISERVIALKPTLINHKAPPLYLFDTTETKMVPLYNVDAEVTVVFFWDPGCGHCKKSIPKLKAVYDKYKNKESIKIYAVCTELETKDWKKFIREKELNDWIHVSDTPEKPSNFRTVYDIFATPKMFLLDKDKKIFAKEIGVEQLEDVLKQKFKIKNDDTWVLDKDGNIPGSKEEKDSEEEEDHAH